LEQMHHDLKTDASHLPIMACGSRHDPHHRWRER